MTDTMSPKNDKAPSNGTGAPDDTACIMSEATADDPVSHTVVQAVATATGRDPTDLPPLYAAIDPDALDTLVSSLTAGTNRQRAHVTFSYAGSQIIVDGHGEVHVTDSEEGDPIIEQL